MHSHTEAGDDHAHMKLAQQYHAVAASWMDSINAGLSLVPEPVWETAGIRAIDAATLMIQGAEAAIPASPGGFLVQAGEKAAAEALLAQMASYRAKLQAALDAANSPPSPAPPPAAQ